MCKCGRNDVASAYLGVCERCRKKHRRDRVEARRSGNCPICNTRPRGKGLRFCQVCNKAVADNTPKNGDWWKDAIRYAVWRGNGIAFMPHGDKFKPAALPQNVLARLPKDDRTIDLDRYCEGFDRAGVNKIKAAIKRAHALRR